MLSLPFPIEDMRHEWSDLDRRIVAFEEEFVCPMLGFKRFSRAKVTIAGIELLHRIRKNQFNLGKLLKHAQTAPAILNAVLAA